MGRSELNSTNQSARTRPDEIVDELIARIFLGEIKAGDQLQPSRALAEELGVDRTSLRMALRQLTRMNVIRPLQGSGITVLDYREHATAEFMAVVFSLPDIDLGGAFLLEAYELYIQAMPAICESVIKRARPAHYQQLDLLFAKQLALLDQKADIEKVVEIELEIHDLFVRVYGSILLVLTTNTARPIRRTIVKLLFDTVDPRGRVVSQREQVRAAMTGKFSSEEIVAAFRAFLQREYQPLHDKLAALPISPSRKKRPSPSKPKKKSKQ